MRRSLLSSAAITAAIVGASAAYAQQAPAPSTTSPATTPSTDTAHDASSAQPSNQLGDIIVTAQRVSENLQKAAVPVDVVSATALVQSGATDPSGLTSLVAGLNIAPTGGGTTSFFIRGVGNFASNPLTDSAVAFNFDNVYIGRSVGTSGLFYDIERVEVLKGPQGTLYGRNATGGAINVDPVHPKPGIFSGYLTGSYGNYNAANFEGAVNVPLGGNSALRVSGTYARHDGYLSDGTSDLDQGGVRAQLYSELTPRLTIRAAFDYEHIGGSGSGSSYGYGRSYNAATGSFFTEYSPLGRSIGLYDPAAQAFRTTLAETVAGRYLAPLDTYPYVNNRIYGASVEIGYDTGFGKLTVIPAWRHDTEDDISSVPGFMAGGQTNDTQYSAELRFAGNRIGIFDYTLGGLYYHERNVLHSNVDQQTLFGTADVTAKTDSYAAFARLTAHLTDRLRVVGGVRYTKDDKSYVGAEDALTIVCLVPPTVPFFPRCPSAPQLPETSTVAQQQATIPVPPLGGLVVVPTGPYAIVHAGDAVNSSLGNSKVTYRGAVEFDVGPRSLLYASVETGFRAGGFNIANGYETYKPETITAYTVGSKNRFFDNRLQLNLEGFYWKYKNQQLGHIGVDLAGNNANFTQNIGRQTIYGADAETRLLVTPTLVLNAEVQYLYTKYDAFSYDVPKTLIPTTGCAVGPDPARPYILINCAGKVAQNSPKWTVNLGADKTFEIGEYKLVGTVDTQYRSGRYVGFEYQDGEYQGSTWQTNVQLSFGPRNDRWSIAGFIRNLDNDRYVINAQYFLFGNGVAYLTAPPRLYGVRGSVKF